MSVQELIAPYLNRFVILLNQNATAKLEFSCAEGKVQVNIFHDLGVPKPIHVPGPPVKKAGYNEVLKKNLKTSQLNRLKRRAAARAEEAKTETLKQNKVAEKAVADAEKARHISEQHHVEAEEAMSDEALDMLVVEANKAMSDEELARLMAEAEKGSYDWEYAEAVKALTDISPANSEHRKQQSSFRCTFCRILFDKKEKFQEHQKEDWAEKTKCQLCGNKLNCMALRKHMKHIHGKNLQWIVKDY